MPDEVKPDATQSPTPQEEAGQAPNPRPTKSKAEGDENAATQSRLHRQAAEAVKARESAERERDELSAKVRQQEKYLEHLLETGQYAEDEKARLKALADKETAAEARERAAEEREKKFAAIAKDLAIKQISAKYGIDPEDLEEYKTPEDMERAAKLAVKYKKGANAEEAEEKPKPTSREAAAEPAVVDMGGGRASRKSVGDMSDTEFDEYHRRQLSAAIRERQRR